jgi:hypothetical protein
LRRSLVRFYDFEVMPLDLRRYLTDQNYRRQIAQEEIRRRRAEATGANPGMEERQLERTLEAGTEDDRREIERRKRTRGLGCRISCDRTHLISSEWDHPISG